MRDHVLELMVQHAFERHIETIRDIAWGCGYAIGVHGSIRRDIDLIAAPWITYATDDEVLARSIAESVNGWILYREGHPTWGAKPHGRRAYTIMLREPHARTYLDLSVMPRLQQCA